MSRSILKAGLLFVIISLFLNNTFAKRVADKTYVSECASCHLAYPSDFLPKRSWKKMMKGLKNHFGDNAELDKAEHKYILDFLVKNAAEGSTNKRAVKILRYMDKGKTPLRISKLKYILKKHDDLSDKHIKNNPKVKTLSNCKVCHREAEKGLFDDDDVVIPNFGKWDD